MRKILSKKYSKWRDWRDALCLGCPPTSTTQKISTSSYNKTQARSGNSLAQSWDSLLSVCNRNGKRFTALSVHTHKKLNLIIIALHFWQQVRTSLLASNREWWIPSFCRVGHRACRYKIIESQGTVSFRPSVRVKISATLFRQLCCGTSSFLHMSGLESGANRMIFQVLTARLS